MSLHTSSPHQRSLPPDDDSIDAFEREFDLSDDDCPDAPPAEAIPVPAQKERQQPPENQSHNKRPRYFEFRAKADDSEKERPAPRRSEKQWPPLEERRPVDKGPQREPLHRLAGRNQEGSWRRDRIRDNRDWSHSGSARRSGHGGHSSAPQRRVAAPRAAERTQGPEAVAPKYDGAPEGAAKEDFSKEFEVDYTAPNKQEAQRETDPHRLSQRQKQVDIGKNTRAYARYIELVPKHRRRWFGKKPVDPTTPDVGQICSKRAFDGQVKVWRRMLHEYDPPADDDEEEIDLAALSNPPAQPPSIPATGMAAADEEAPAAPGSNDPHDGRHAGTTGKRSAEEAALEEGTAGRADEAPAKAVRYEEDPEDLIYLPVAAAEPKEPHMGDKDQNQDDDSDWDIDDVAI